LQLEYDVSSYDLPLLITFAAYIAIILTIAYISTRLTSNLSDYVLAGRRLSGPVTALAAGASDMGSWLLMALPGTVYIAGLNMIWLPLGLVIGAYFNWRFIAKRIRVYTEIAGDSLTIPEFFANRFKDKSMTLRLAIAIAIIVFFTYYAGASLRSGAILIQNVFIGVDYFPALLIGAAVIVTYTILGGFLAVSWVDFFQGSLMFVALLVVPIVTCFKLGGVTETWKNLALQSPTHLEIFQDMKLFGILSMLAWGLGYFGQLHINTRFMAIRSAKELPVARFICINWMSWALIGAVATGLLGYTFYYSAPLSEPDTVFILLAQQLFNPWVAGILVSAVSAAIMNTVSAQILMSASIIVEDFYHAILRKNASDRENLLASRIILLLVAITAIGVASAPSQTIFKAVSFAWSGLGSAFGPVLLFSLFWRRMTKEGAVWGIVSGAATVILWEILSHPSVDLLNHPDILPGFALLPGFIVSSICIFLVSMNSKPPSAEVVQEFDHAMQVVKSIQ
jgi:sodium/proline symporter